MIKVIQTLAGPMGIIAQVIRTSYFNSDTQEDDASYDVVVFAEDTKHYRELPCDDLAHAMKVFDAIKTCHFDNANTLLSKEERTILEGKCPACKSENFASVHPEYDKCEDCGKIFVSKDILEGD